MAFKGGYWGKFLEVDLTTRSIKKVEFDDEFARKYLGGVGFGNKFLYDRVPAGTDPLSPENIIMWMVGPLNGTSFHGQKMYITFKSPLTGNFGFCKHGGGTAWELKFAGWDGVIVTGKAESPVYIYIKDDDVQIRDASRIWGKDTMVTGVSIQEEVGDVFTKVSCCGPAGENLVRFGAIFGELGKAGARTGGGAVMGSKNLKALAVRGTQTVPLANPEEFHELTTKLRKILKEQAGTRSRWGTCTYTSSSNDAKNFLMSCWPEVQRACSAEAQEKMFWVRDFSCPGCPSICFRRGVIRQGPFTGRVGESSEYDTSILGLGCGVTDLFGFLNNVQLCDKLGLDGTSTGAVIAWVMECYEKGILTKDDLDGLELTWGNTLAMDKLIKKIAFREGVGDLLAEGTKRASEKIGKGSENLAMQIKGLEMAAHDPRGKSSLSEGRRPGAMVGTAIGYATASRGGDHITDRNCTQDATGQCLFSVSQMGGVNVPEEIVNLIRLATGWEDYSLEEYNTTNERLLTLRRLFNVREGMGRKNDVLPERFYTLQIPIGQMKGKVVSQEEFEKELDKFYEARGWDEQGIPTEEMLKKLCLEDMV
ncbi:aldehyde ferredoxin oxidoreductase family protein [Chloroflexota bacterium]